MVRLLPRLAFPSLRAALYRLAGLSIGRRTLIGGRLELIGMGAIGRRLKVGSHCYFTTPLFVDLTADVTIGDHVTIGHHVVLITADHEIGSSWRRGGAVSPKSIMIGDGVWIAARVTVLPGARIGPGTVIGAGSLVKGEIPPGVVAAGSPARVIRELGPDPQG
jgi:maltose O-acetyltransferase